jgi:hypothetical protein
MTTLQLFRPGRVRSSRNHGGMCDEQFTRPNWLPGETPLYPQYPPQGYPPQGYQPQYPPPGAGYGQNPYSPPPPENRQE